MFLPGPFPLSVCCSTFMKVAQETICHTSFTPRCTFRLACYLSLRYLYLMIPPPPLNTQQHFSLQNSRGIVVLVTNIRPRISLSKAALLYKTSSSHTWCLNYPSWRKLKPELSWLWVFMNQGKTSHFFKQQRRSRGKTLWKSGWKWVIFFLFIW